MLGAVTSPGPARAVGMAGSLLEPRVAGHKRLSWLCARDALRPQSHSASPLLEFILLLIPLILALAAAEQRGCHQASVTPGYHSLVTSHSALK